MAMSPHRYGGDGVCVRCSHDSYSSGSDYCEDNPKRVLNRHKGMVPNPYYKPLLDVTDDPASDDKNG